MRDARWGKRWNLKSLCHSTHIFHPASHSRMKAFRKLYRANFTEFLSNRRALFLTVAFPVLFIVIFGLVFTNQDKADARIGVAAADPGDEVSREIVKALQQVPRGEARPGGRVDGANAERNPFSKLAFVSGGERALREDLRRGRIDAVITIPAGLTAKAAAAKELALKTAATELQGMKDLADLADDDDDNTADGGKGKPSPTPGPAASMPAPSPSPTPPPPTPEPVHPAELVLTIDPSRQTLLPILQGILGHVLGGIDAGITEMPPLLALRTEATTAREVRTIDYLLPGILAMSIMQLGLFATAQPLVAMRVQGVLKRLSATPLPRLTLLASYVSFRLTIALFQTALCVLIGRYAFAVAMVGSWWAFAGWIFLGTLTFLSIGFFMAAVSRNEESCIAIGNIVNLPMILLSGTFFPVNHLSRVFDYILPFVPLNYLSDALRVTMVDAIPLHRPLTDALVLAGWIVAMTALAVRFFSWDTR